MEKLTRSRLEEILKRGRQLRVGVVGDYTLDAYWYADMLRAKISRETPLFPRPIVNETYTAGGAANVAWNLAAMGLAEVYALTVVGPDWRWDLLCQRLQQAGVRIDQVMVQPGWTTPFYGKVILTANQLQQEDSRLDFINTEALPAEVEAILLERIETLLPNLDALVVTDYQPCGILSKSARAALNRMAKQHSEVVFIADSREEIAEFGDMIIKPNEFEATRLLLPEYNQDRWNLKDLELAGLEWQRRHSKPVFITLGERGCLILEDGHSSLLPPIPIQPPLDPVGAGDTFLAGLLIGLSAGATTIQAGQLASLAAAVTVRKLHTTGTASPMEILELFERLDCEGYWS